MNKEGNAMENMLQDPSMQNTINEARQIANMIKSQRTQARTQPAISALSGLASQYGSAQTDEQRQQLNALANLTRNNYLQGGGSPADLPKNLWGSDPMQGFQTSEGYQAPITGYEGLKRPDAIGASRQSMLDSLTKEQWRGSPESQDWYLPLTKQTMEAQLTNLMRPPSTGGGGGGTTAKTYSLADLAKAKAQNDPRLWIGDEEPPEGRWTMEGLQNAWLQDPFGQQPQANDPMVLMIQQAKAQGIPADQIRQGLAAEGVDPSKYGY